MAHTEAEINELLAELGLRTPGQSPPHEPERIVAGELLDTRARVKELVGEGLICNTHVAQLEAERDRLAPFEGRAMELATELDRCHAQVQGFRTASDVLKLERDEAYKMVKDLEVRVRSLQAHLDQVSRPVPGNPNNPGNPGGGGGNSGGNAGGQGGGKP